MRIYYLIFKNILFCKQHMVGGYGARYIVICFNKIYTIITGYMF